MLEGFINESILARAQKKGLAEIHLHNLRDYSTNKWRRVDDYPYGGLPNIKSAKKRVLIAEVRNARNKATKSEVKTAIKKFEAAAAEGNRTEADGAYKVAVKKVDQAVAKGVLHKNTAAHRKSAMTLKLNKIG